MPRPRKNPADLFGYPEFAVATGMSVYDVKYVLESREDLVPPGRGIRALKRMATIGAFKSGGLALFTAARLARAVLDEFNQNDGEAPSGLNYLARQLPRQAIKSLLPAQAVQTNDYHYHYALFQQPNDCYPKGQALGSDAMIEIVDFRLIFLSSRQFSKPGFVGWIEGLNRGGDARIVHITEKIGTPDDEANPGWRAVEKKIERAALTERDSAIARTAINLSLAIRVALDRVAQHRASADVSS